MDRDPALMNKRKKVMGIWDVIIAFAYGMTLSLTAYLLFLTVNTLLPQGIEVAMTVVGIVISFSAGILGLIARANKELKSDISTGDSFISAPNKELSLAYDEVDKLIVARLAVLKEEHPIVFISSLSYYPTYTKRRHVVAASVVMTLRR